MSSWNSSTYKVFLTLCFVSGFVKLVFGLEKTLRVKSSRIGELRYCEVSSATGHLESHLIEVVLSSDLHCGSLQHLAQDEVFFMERKSKQDCLESQQMLPPRGTISAATSCALRPLSMARCAARAALSVVKPQILQIV